MTLPVILYNERVASDAYEVHQALLWLETRHPELTRNSRWCKLRERAFEDFTRAFTMEIAA